jgi:hypothetical protein
LLFSFLWTPGNIESILYGLIEKLKLDFGLFRWRLGNQRWNQQAEFSSALAASNKLTSATAVIEASAIALLSVPKRLVIIHNAASHRYQQSREGRVCS